METDLNGMMKYVDAAIAKGTGSEEFDVVRKLAAIAIYVASNGNVSPEAAAAQSDGAVFEKSVQYKAGEGILTEEEVVELLENRQACSFVAICRNFIAKAVDNGCTALGGCLGGLVGHPLIGMKIGAAVGRFLNEPVGRIVEAGAKKAQSWMEQALDWTAEKIDGIADATVDWIESL